MANYQNKESIDRINAFILANHRLLTKKELADETGISPSTLKIYCDKIGVTPITPRERACEYIIKHQHDKTQEEIADKLEMICQHVRNYAKELGITLKRDCDKLIKKVEEPIKYDRAPAIYTQSGNDITDQLREIKTTLRIEVNAKDAFFK